MRFPGNPVAVDGAVACDGAIRGVGFAARTMGATCDTIGRIAATDDPEVGVGDALEDAAAANAVEQRPRRPSAAMLARADPCKVSRER